MMTKENPKKKLPFELKLDGNVLTSQKKKRQLTKAEEEFVQNIEYSARDPVDLNKKSE